MKTSVELQDEKLEMAKELAGGGTLKDLLNEALDAYIEKRRRQKMIDLLGTDFFDGNIKKMRGR